MKKYKTVFRHNARCYAMQAIYQWQFTQQNVDEIIQTFQDENDFQHVDESYFKELVSGVVKEIHEVDITLQPYLDREIQDLNPVELAILRLATYELLYRPDIPYRVVINEAVEIAKEYGSVEGYKYINGVLDALVKNR